LSRIRDTGKVRGAKTGRRSPVFSGLPNDPIDNLLNLTGGRLNIPESGSIRGGEYDFLGKVSTNLRRRAAGSMIISRRGGLPIDALLEDAAARDPRLANLNPDEFGTWFFQQVESGLDFRQEVRAAGGVKKYQAMQARIAEQAQVDRLSGLKSDFLASASEDEYGEYLAKRFTDESVDHLGEGASVAKYDVEQMAKFANQEMIRDREELFKLSESKTVRMSGSAGNAIVQKTDSSLSIGGRLQSAVIVDLDDTLFTPTKVARKLEEELMAQKAKGSVPSSAWRKWNKAIEKSRPIPEMIDFVKQLQNAGIQPVIMTARDEAMRPFTTKVLQRHGIDTSHLMFKGLSQEQQDMAPAAVKAKMMESVKDQFNFLAFLDDSKSNLEAGYRFNVPLGIQPMRGGHDSLEAAIVRGVKIADEMGEDTLIKAVDALKGFSHAGKVSNSTLQRIFDSGITAMNVVKNRLV
jgi:predicted secreted acid phosphatase